MFGSQPKKQYYWQLREFRQCDPDKYKEMVIRQKEYIYLFKKGIPDVVVRIQQPLEKIHCWTFNQIQVIQRLNDNPKVFHCKHVHLPFRGQLILSILDNFNRSLKEQIQLAIPNQTKSLRQWLNSNLDDIFLFKLKSQQSFGHQHAFCQIQTLYRTRYKNYFQMKGWKASTWQGLLDIAETEKIEANNSYGLHLEEINSFICKFEVINNQLYEDMFQIHTKKPAQKREKDVYQLAYQKKVLLKYGLTEYLEK